MARHEAQTRCMPHVTNKERSVVPTALGSTIAATAVGDRADCVDQTTLPASACHALTGVSRVPAWSVSPFLRHPFDTPSRHEKACLLSSGLKFVSSTFIPIRSVSALTPETRIPPRQNCRALADFSFLAFVVACAC